MTIGDQRRLMRELALTECDLRDAVMLCWKNGGDLGPLLDILVRLQDRVVALRSELRSKYRGAEEVTNL